MTFRFFYMSGLQGLALCVGLLPGVLKAATSDWDCAQAGPDKEWDCGSKQPLNATPTAVATTNNQDSADVSVDTTTEPVGAAIEKPAVATKMVVPEKAPVKGWNCSPEDAEGGDTGWKCSLEGRDPRGKAHQVVETDEEPKNWAESNDITQEDEWRFEHMMSLMPVNPWERACAPRVGKKRPPPMAEFLLSPAEKLAREKAPIEIQSDHFEMIDGEVTNFSGGAEMVKADQKLWGDYITRNLRTNAINVHGNVTYQEKGMSLTSDTGFMDGAANRGIFRNSQFILPTVPGRGTSRLTHIDSNTLSRYENFTYTTCPTGDQDWKLHASHVKINKETGTGTAHNAWFEFMDVPMFYTPYMDFPTDARRVSGLLPPSFGVTEVGGFDLRVPYYFNLAPNYDYTAQPRYLTKRGFLLANEFRYVGDMTRGKIIADIMPEDQITHTTRGKVNVLNDTRFSENLSGRVNANWLSDYNYPTELGSPLNITDYRNVASNATLNYGSPFGAMGAMVNYFQTIDPTIPKNQYPYYFLPSLTHSYGGDVFGTGLMYNLPTQYANIQSSGEGMTTAQRFSLRPNLSYPMESSIGFIKPSATLAFNQYMMDSPQYWNQVQQGQGVTSTAGTSENFTVPILSLDSGTYFDRETTIGEQAITHTLEPRLFYVYIPTVNQQNVPIFDTTTYDSTYYQLFRENRFTGNDRIGDTNELTAAMTTRLIDQSSGLERFRATFGNQAYFKDRQVTLAGAPPKTYQQSFSNLIGDVGSAITENWSVYSGGQYNAEFNQIERGQVGLQYNNRKNQILNLAYRYRRNQYFDGGCDINNPNNGCLNLTDASFRLPILAGWHAIGRWEYSFLNNITLESFFGFEKETCCWRFTVLARRYINTIEPPSAEHPQGYGQANNAVFFQLELKGLTTLGDEVDQFLERSVTGYRFRNY